MNHPTSTPQPPAPILPQLIIFKGLAQLRGPSTAAQGTAQGRTGTCGAANSEDENVCFIWAMVNTRYMVDGHPIHKKDPYNGYYKSLWTIGWLAPINGY